MKTPVTLLLIFFHLIPYLGCKKDSITFRDHSGTANRRNTAPKVYAGADTFLILPNNEILLKGSFSDAENNVKNVSWNKISGPDSYELENKNSAQTKLMHLVQGYYQFALAVADSSGMTGKDTILVTVVQSNDADGLIFKDLKWIFPWYNSLEIPDFHDIVAQGKPYKVFIHRENIPAWIEVSPDDANLPIGSYGYWIETRPDGAGMYHYGSLYIFYYGSDVGDTPDVKIVL